MQKYDKKIIWKRNAEEISPSAVFYSGGGHASFALRRRRACTTCRKGDRYSAQYAAESTRVLAAKYAAAFRTASRA